MSLRLNNPAAPAAPFSFNGPRPSGNPRASASGNTATASFKGLAASASFNNQQTAPTTSPSNPSRPTSPNGGGSDASGAGAAQTSGAPGGSDAALSLGFGNQSMQQLRPEGVKAKAGGGDVSDLKKCGMGCYLCYKEDNFGTFYMHWSENTPPNALLWMQPQATVPKFKFTQNGGRVQLADRVNSPTKWFASIARYVREQVASMKANKITILAHSENKEIQLLFLKKSNKVFILRESGKSVLYEPDEIEAIGVVPYNNTDFLVKTMHTNIFADKCTHAGACLMK